MRHWITTTLAQFKAMPAPEQWMIGSSFVAFVIALIAALWSGIDGLQQL